MFFFFAIEIALGILPKIFIIIILLSSCERCTKEVNLLAFSLTNIEVKSDHGKTFDLMVRMTSLSVVDIKFDFFHILARKFFTSNDARTNSIFCGRCF